MTSVLVAAGAPARAASAPVTDLETLAIEITGLPLTPGGTIPAGTPLRVVTLATADPWTAAADGRTLSRSEEVTVRVDGVVVATALPRVEYAPLETDAGQVFGPAFSADGSTYLLPQTGTDLTGITATVASTQVRDNNISTIQAFAYGLLPAGAAARSGAYYVEADGPAGTAQGTGTSTLHDADDIRGSADSPDEEILGGISAEGFEEVRAVFRLKEGGKVEALAIRRSSSFYGTAYRYYYIEAAPLAAAGVTPDDIAGVKSVRPAGHGLTWTELGF
ncbi:hypothetical protein [Streptomyces aidingensis]|nr:hypothetical protein [Streptomyces aidingensis]